MFEEFKLLTTDLVGVIVSQAAAEIGVTPGKGLAPGGRNQNFVLLYSEDALVSGHNLSHRVFQLWKTTRTHEEV